jgi:TonB-dependent SusC/RagA subfamily outer membrane receptor
MINWQTLISDPFIQTIGWTLFHSIWEGFIIAAMLSFVLSLLWKDSANSRYLSSIAAMVFLLICLTGTFVWQYHSHHSLTHVPLAQVDTPFNIFDEEDQQALTEDSGYIWEGIWADQIEPFLQTNMPFIVLLWLLGASLFAMKFIGSYFYLYRLSHYQLKPLPQPWQNKIKKLSDQIGLSKPVRVLESALVDEPLTLRHIKPLILVPMGLISGLSTDQLEAVLLHELAHIRRADYLINLIQSMIEIVLFYHPAVWWISGRIRQTREESCDDLVMQTGRDVMTYAEALTTIQSFYRSPKPSLTMTAIGKKGQFTARIQRLFGQPQKQNSTSKSLLSIFVIFACLATLAFQKPALIDEKTQIKANPVLKEIPVDKSAQTLKHPINVDNLHHQPPSSLKASGQSTMKEKTQIKIDANTSQADLDRLIKRLAKKGIELDVQTSYSESGKLIKISGKIDFGEGSFGSFKAQGESLFVVINYSEDGELSIQSGNLDNEWVEKAPATEENTWTEETEEPEIEIVAGVHVESAEPENEFEKEEEMESANEDIHEPTVEGEKVKVRIRQNDQNSGQPLFVVDGKILVEKSKEEALKEISPQDIESINVLKNESAIEKYGKDGANGVIEVFTKLDKRPKSEREQEIELKIRERKKLEAERKQKLIDAKLKSEDETVSQSDLDGFQFKTAGKEPYIIVDGQPVDQSRSLTEMVEKGELKKEDIKTVNVLKGKSAKALYGSKGKHGVIVITTKKKK